MRKICVITGTRAEYGLLRWLMHEIESDPGLELQIVATGTHLSAEFGLTYRAIEQDGFVISRKIEMLLSADSSAAIVKSMGLAQIGLADALDQLQPDIVVLLGDRFEIAACALACAISRIPVAHIHGGEVTEGAVDEALRHAITKMAHIHFTAAEDFSRRVIQMGEQPSRVYTVGAPGLDNIERLTLLTRAELGQQLGFETGPRWVLVTFHPVTLEVDSTHQQMQQLLSAIESIPDLRAVFTMPNADMEGRTIMRLIEDFCRQRPDRFAAYGSLGQVRYLSALKYADAVVGNSSSGIIEAPAVGTPTVNIGERQKGRPAADSVLSCKPEAHEIRNAIETALSPEFRERAAIQTIPYGSPGASQRIKAILKEVNLENILKKPFHDIEVRA